MRKRHLKRTPRISLRKMKKAVISRLPKTVLKITLKNLKTRCNKPKMVKKLVKMGLKANKNHLLS